MREWLWCSLSSTGLGSPCEFVSSQPQHTDPGGICITKELKQINISKLWRMGHVISHVGRLSITAFFLYRFSFLHGGMQFLREEAHGLQALLGRQALPHFFLQASHLPQPTESSGVHAPCLEGKERRSGFSFFLACASGMCNDGPSVLASDSAHP